MQLADSLGLSDADSAASPSPSLLDAPGAWLLPCAATTTAAGQPAAAGVAVPGAGTWAGHNAAHPYQPEVCAGRGGPCLFHPSTCWVPGMSGAACSFCICVYTPCCGTHILPPALFPCRQLYSPAPEAVPGLRGVGGRAPAATRAGAPTPAGQLLRQFTAALESSPTTTGRGVADTAAPGPACVWVQQGAGGTPAQACRSLPSSVQWPAGPGQQQAAGGLQQRLGGAVAFHSNIGDHRSACSDASRSTAAPSLRLCGESMRLGSSCSTLLEVISPETYQAGPAEAMPAGAGMGAAAEEARCTALLRRLRRPIEVGGLASPATPGVHSPGIGSHLSDATPSDAGSSLKVPTTGEVISIGRRGTTSFGEEAGGGAAVAEPKQGRRWAGVGALRTLKSRLVLSRRVSA